MKRDVGVFLDEDRFISNVQLQDSVIRRFEIIGEAVKHIPQELKNEISRDSLERNCRQ